MWMQLDHSRVTKTYLVTFLKRIAPAKYTRTEQEDWVGSRDVIRALPAPVISDRYIKFTTSVEAE